MAIKPTPELLRAINEFKKGDAQAFEALYHHSLKYLTRCVLTVVNRTAPDASEDLVQDILQDTYLTIAEKLDTLQNEETFFQWAGQIATNHALRTWNKAQHRQAMEQSEDDMVYELVDEDFIPEDILENKEKQQLIRKMLQELPTPQYLCLVEYFYNGLKEREIAEKLGMPLGTVKTNLSRAKKKLKDIVETHEKKHGVKLYSMSWLLILLFMDEVKELFIDAGTAGATLGAVTTQMAAGTAAGTAGGAAAVGITAKIVAGIVAAAVVIGGIGLAVSNPPEAPAPTAAQTLPQSTETLPEETVPQPAPISDVVLLPKDLEYINQVISCMELGVVPTGPLVPYYKGGNNLNITPYVVNCAGTNGLLKGTETGDGLLVKKADLEAFMLDTLGCVKEIVTDGTHGIRVYNTDSYLMEDYYGNREHDIIIHNMSAVDQNTISVIALKDSTTYACTFERSADSQYGWVLTKATDRQEKQTTIARPRYISMGVVLPENGEPLLDGSNLSAEAAVAYVKQYLLATTGSIPYEVICVKTIGIQNNDPIHCISCNDEDGAALYDFIIDPFYYAIGICDRSDFENADNGFNKHIETILWPLPQ